MNKTELELWLDSLLLAHKMMCTPFNDDIYCINCLSYIQLSNIESIQEIADCLGIDVDIRDRGDSDYRWEKSFMYKDVKILAVGDER